jgi:DNA anti-recombination protein RmuC
VCMLVALQDSNLSSGAKVEELQAQLQKEQQQREQQERDGQSSAQGLQADKEELAKRVADLVSPSCCS